MDGSEQTRSSRALQRTQGDRSPFFVVVEEESSFVFDLPAEGVVHIGRGSTCDIRLKNESASRCHADVIVTAGSISIFDRNSRNGTFVNGQRVVGARSLEDGAVVSVGDATLVLNCQMAGGEISQDFELVRQRLDESVRRALVGGQSVAVIALYCAEWRNEEHDDILEKCRCQLRSTDAAGWDESGRLIGVLWDLTGDEAENLVNRLAAELRGASSPVSAGVAVCPADAREADALLGHARAALATQASQSRIDPVDEMPKQITVGDRSILVADPSMIRIYELIRRLAPTPLPVLVLGETGVGKESAAFAVHTWSRRNHGPFVTLNSAALPETLIESELFGHEKGAFSGAVATKRGLFETAAGGTIFLDEVGDLSPAAQAKLLRALDAKRIIRVGGTGEIDIDVRIVAATNHLLESEVEAGRFRRDLFHRLSAATIVVPPLRERPREITMLARWFLSETCVRLERPPLEISSSVMRRLSSYSWPGNVRELRNVIDFAAVTSEPDIAVLTGLPEHVGPSNDPNRAARSGSGTASISGRGDEMNDLVSPMPLAQMMREFERRRMLEALEAAGGVQKRAAELLGMPLRTFMLRMKQHGLVVERRAR